ncbi:MAG: hypothetical protein LC715_07895 [Gammaproteobacteria bacterium]|nr:hypothetical protein [Gammaproteobacteria bacterium]
MRKLSLLTLPVLLAASLAAQLGPASPRSVKNLIVPSNAGTTSRMRAHGYCADACAR